MASASASQNYISNTLKWKKKLSFLKKGSSASASTNIIQDASMNFKSDSQSKIKTLQENIEKLVKILKLS